MAKSFPDADFLPIYTGIRTLRPACDIIVTAVATNHMHCLEDIEKAVMEMVKDSCRKWNDTNNKGKMVVPNPAISPRQVVVHELLLPPGVLHKRGAGTTIGNPGQLAPNTAPVRVPAGGQLGPAPTAAAGPNVPAAQGTIPAAGQLGKGPPGATGPNLAAAGQLGEGPPGAAGPNVRAPQVNIPAAGQLGQAPPGAARPNRPAPQVNVGAAGQLGQAPPGLAGPNVPAAHVKVTAAGQLAQASQSDVPAAGWDGPVQHRNYPAHPRLVRDSRSPANYSAHPLSVGDSSSQDNDPALEPMLPDPPHNGPAVVQNEPVSPGFRPAPNCRPTG